MSIHMWTYLSSDNSHDFWCSSLHSLQSTKERKKWRTLSMTRVQTWSKRINLSDLFYHPYKEGISLLLQIFIYSPQFCLWQFFFVVFFFCPVQGLPSVPVVSGLAGVGGIQCWLLCLLLLSISKHLQYGFSYCDTTATATSPLLLMELTKLLLLLTFNLQRFSWKNFAKTNKDIHI